MFGGGAPKPAFGAATGGGGGLFGAANNNAGGFGGNAANNNNNNNNTTPAFGNNNAGGFGGAAAGTQNQTNTGTANTPFAAYVEKDSASSTNSHYQSITFQPPYQNYSFEELRLADYNGGRRYGNSNGQAGAFGQSNFGGGFGANAGGATAGGGFGQAAAPGNAGGGLFGSNNNNNNNNAQNQTQNQNPFGQAAQPATGGFGGGLFGNNKPAGGGLFGAAPAATAQPAAGGIFGAAAPAATGGGAFGGFGNNNSATGGGLFGAAANQPKPAFGGFGASTSAAPTGGFGASAGAPAFGNTPATTGGGGLFGNASAANTNSSPFGGAQQNNAPTGGGLFGGAAFGQNNQQQNNQTASGNLFGGGGGAFGQNNQANQAKPSLFGASATAAPSGGLFGNNNNNQQNQAQGGGLFGNNNNSNQQQQGGGLFGNQPKPAGGLFGASAGNNANAGGGLFGGLGNNNNNQQNQQNQGGSLFGQTNQQAKPSLFGNMNGAANNNNNGGGSLFGNSNSNNNNGGLFGQQNQQQQSGGFFGNSQQNQQNNQQQNLAATLMSNPYGNDQLFSGIGSPQPAVGPLATPLSGAQKPAKRPAALPAFKINPSASLRLITPQKRTTNGYGFSYATYGTPGSAQSFTSNGLGSSLLQSGGLSRSLGKSFSTTNLRSTFSAEDSVLAPGAFTPNNRPYSGGSIRRLKIDRSLRTDLFGSQTSSEPPTLNRKRVSFDASGTSGAPKTNGSEATSSALVRTEGQTAESPSENPPEDPLGLLYAERVRASGRKMNYRTGEITSNGTNGASTPGRPEMEQARPNELSIVPEDEAAHAESSNRAAISKDVPKSQSDQQPEEYYMSPTIRELRNFSRDQLKKVSGFTVGRRGVGRIEFGDVDLTEVPLDNLFGDIIRIEVRSATVYQDRTDTPPRGKGLNVPSLITLENCWPRSHGGRLPVHERKGLRFDKHVERLKRVVDTEFVGYNPETGFWQFRVEHFTTYGLGDDEEDDETDMGTSMMETDDQTPKVDTAVTSQEMVQVSPDEGSVMSEEDSNPDDTFEFKRGPSMNIPGGFGDQSIYEDLDMADDTDAQTATPEQHGMSMFDKPSDRSGRAIAVQAEDRPIEEVVEQDIVGSFPEPAFGDNFSESIMPKSILKTSYWGTPKKDITLTGDWAEQLQRTVSPKKQDRQALRQRQSVMGEHPVNNAPFAASLAGGKAFSTTMDIMNSLWAPAASTNANKIKTTAGGKGFEV